MNKAELVQSVAAKTELTKKKTDEVVNAVLESIKEALAEGDKVMLVGFGAFSVRKRAGRKARNPRNGEEIQIPPSVVPVFKAGKGLKSSV